MYSFLYDRNNIIIVGLLLIILFLIFMNKEKFTISGETDEQSVSGYNSFKLSDVDNNNCYKITNYGENNSQCPTTAPWMLVKNSGYKKNVYTGEKVEYVRPDDLSITSNYCCKT